MANIAGTVYTKGIHNFILSNNVWTSVLSLTLPAGTYIIGQHTHFAKGGAGARAIRLSKGNAAYSPSTQLVESVDGKSVHMSYCTFAKISESGTFDFQAYQSGGVDIELTSFSYRVLKIV